MIDLYVFTTANCWKASIMLEEVGLPYTPHLVHLRKGEHRTPEYLERVPAGKVPSMVDRDADLPIFGSSAILLYLAEKTGKLLPKDGRARVETIDWFMFATTDFGIGFIQWSQFAHTLTVRDEYATNLTRDFVERICKVADDRLRDHEYFADEYSIADIAAFPFLCRKRRDEGLLQPYPNLERWADAVEARKAVQRGLEVPVVPGQGSGQPRAILEAL